MEQQENKQIIGKILINEIKRKELPPSEAYTILSKRKFKMKEQKQKISSAFINRIEKVELPQEEAYKIMKLKPKSKIIEK